MTSASLELFVAGHCVHPEHVVLRNRVLRPMCFPASFALLRHPERGPILFDTGYSEAFLEATRTFPNRLYRVVTPVTMRAEDTAANQLRAHGVAPEEVALVVVSHFHADHVAGLRDFPRATFVHLGEAWRAVAGLRGLGALRRGFLPALVPDDFVARASPLEAARFTALPSELAPFRRGVDLFGDGSCWVIALPGHAAGQLGLAVRTTGGRTVFLCADAAWASRSIREDRMPHAIARTLFDDWGAYRVTLGELHALHAARPEVSLVPAHCAEALASFGVRHDAAAGTFTRG